MDIKGKIRVETAEDDILNYLDENNLSVKSLSQKVENLIFLGKKKKKSYNIKNNIQKISFTDLMKRVSN